MIALALLASFAIDPAPALVYGVGAASCATIQGASGVKAREWVLAAWSGKNGEFGHVGDSLGVTGIISAVMKQCHPDRVFTTIALATDRAFKAAEAARH